MKMVTNQFHKASLLVWNVACHLKAMKILVNQPFKLPRFENKKNSEKIV